MKKVLAAAGIGAAVTVGSLLGAGTANASDQMLKVGTDIQPGDYVYTVSGGYDIGGSYYLCATANCSDLDDIIDVDAVMGPDGTTGYLTIGSDVKFVKLSNLELTPA
jgi:hypothetical protein